MCATECNAFSTYCSENGCNTFSIVCLLISVFFTVLFLQSGLDKVNDHKGNLSWLKGHFEKSFLKNIVPVLLISITLLELAAGTFSLAGSITWFIKGCNCWMYWGNLLACISLIFLFAGQRIAKDYAGAQSLVSYFILALMGLYLTC